MPGRSEGQERQRVDIFLHPTEDFEAKVDAKVERGMNQAVRVSVTESQRQTERNFVGMQRQARVRKG